ncbi:MAG: hypothetical protein WCK48_03285 [bacterium]
MPPEKKPDKPAPPPAPTSQDPFVEIVSFIALAFFAIYIINGFVSLLTTSRIFTCGLSCFTPQAIVLSHTRPIASLNDAINAKVISSKDTTAVYDSPGEKQVGSQTFGTKGKILQGPVTINGERYWYVDYETGADGWVKESDLAYVESEPSVFEKIVISALSFVWLLRYVSVLISLLFILAVVFLYMKIRKLRMIEHALLYPQIEVAEPDVNPKWQKILDHSESLNENDWRLAIIEADIMLNDLLSKLSLPGDTIGEKLKAVEKSDFTTIDNAWEAHKIRNEIAHQGSDFLLNQREARRVIELYRTVFDEFKII